MHPGRLVLGPGDPGLLLLRSGCLGEKESELEMDWKNRLELTRVPTCESHGAVRESRGGGALFREGKKVHGLSGSIRAA